MSLSHARPEPLSLAGALADASARRGALVVLGDPDESLAKISFTSRPRAPAGAIEKRDKRKTKKWVLPTSRAFWSIFKVRAHGPSDGRFDVGIGCRACRAAGLPVVRTPER